MLKFNTLTSLLACRRSPSLLSWTCRHWCDLTEQRRLVVRQVGDQPDPSCICFTVSVWLAEEEKEAASFRQKTREAVHCSLFFDWDAFMHYLRHPDVGPSWVLNKRTFDTLHISAEAALKGQFTANSKIHICALRLVNWVTKLSRWPNSTTGASDFGVFCLLKSNCLEINLLLALITLENRWMARFKRELGQFSTTAPCPCFSTLPGNRTVAGNCQNSPSITGHQVFDTYRSSLEGPWTARPQRTFSLMCERSNIEKNAVIWRQYCKWDYILYKKNQRIKN